MRTDWKKCKICGEDYMKLIDGICMSCKLDKIKKIGVTENIPERYKECTFETFIPNNDTIKMVELALEFIDVNNDRGLFLSGTAGIGKTHLLYATYMRILERQPNVKVLRYPHLLMMYGSRYSESFVDKVEEMCATPYLLIDDFKISTDKKQLEMAEYIFDDRYNHKLNKILVTSNITIEDISQHISDRIASRIGGMCEYIEVKAEDYRLKTK